MAEEARQSAVELFRRSFGAEPEFVVRSPGRVNLIGDHTDYNDGFVLPMAIDRSVWLAGRMTTGIVAVLTLTKHITMAARLRVMGQVSRIG